MLTIYLSIIQSSTSGTALSECATQGVAVSGRLSYIPPEAAEDDDRPNAKRDVYAFGVNMWQLVSRVVFPPDEYMDKDVYQIDRVPACQNGTNSFTYLAWTKTAANCLT